MSLLTRDIVVNLSPIHGQRSNRHFRNWLALDKSRPDRASEDLALNRKQTRLGNRDDYTQNDSINRHVSRFTFHFSHRI
jgi:hypothetical protein